MSADMKLTISGGRLIDPANGIDALQDIHISDGVIAAIGKAPDGFTPDQTLDAKGQIVCPGLVDLCARLREPGLEHKGTIESETRAAAASGITTLACPPDTSPVTDTPAVVELIRERSQQAGFAHVYSLGALTQQLAGQHITEMAALQAAGCVGVSNALRPVTNHLVMRRAMEYAATFDLTVYLHPEDAVLRNDGSVHEGMVSTRMGLRGIPEAAETVAVASYLALAKDTGVRIHFSHLSTAHAVKMVGRAQHDGLPVSADVTAHHLYLTDRDISDFNSQCFVEPPLRTERDMQALRDGLVGGQIAAICSDHQPHEPDAKLAPFSATEPGASTLETLLPLSLRLADETSMSISEVIARLTSAPANILGINAGHLAPGQNADVCIFNPDSYWTLSEDTLISRGHNTPFLGWELKGKVTTTLLSGKVVYAASNKK